MNHDRKKACFALLAALCFAVGVSLPVSAGAVKCYRRNMSGTIVHEYVRRDEGMHWDTCRSVLQCESCGYIYSSQIYRKPKEHVFVCTDAGHVPGEAEHRYEKRCRDCGCAETGSAFLLPCCKPCCSKRAEGQTPH